MDRERERDYAGSPSFSKKVTWKEPIEQHVSLLTPKTPFKIRGLSARLV